MESSECFASKGLGLVDFSSLRNGANEPEGPEAHPISVRDEVKR
jgi:hypothetical protein